MDFGLQFAYEVASLKKRSGLQFAYEAASLKKRTEAFLADLDVTLNERKTQHGDFTDHARIAQALKDRMRGEANWEKLSATQKEALEMIQHKIARILAGDSNHADHWVDIEGYSRIARERLSNILVRR